MSTNRIRKNFLKYFSERGHRVVPSSPVFPFDDPTLLFINAGMNQFKDVFLGKSQRDYTKAVSAQKCVRVGGKHNDLENVGHTSRHLTFFEMLGNFSFGDYFKKEAIQFAWEVSVDVFGLDPDRIWPTVFRDDDEAFELWKQYVPEGRITRFEEKQNFWAMGDQGPCGPCSELLYDRGEAYGKAKNPKEDVKEERFLEFWNLVFMQYNRDENEKMISLPRPSIDTGAGIERIVALQMNVENVFETDVLRGLIAEVEEISGVAYRANDLELSPAFHVIADHMRTLSFAIADGLQPGNVERGYVLRKVLRRAVRYGRMLGLDRPFLAKVLPRLITLMGDDYPELQTAKDPIAEILTQEEETFLRTLHRGGNLLSQIVEKAKTHGHQIKGEEAFKLKDTYGLPFEEILLLAKDADLSVDEKRYNELDEEARERSRQAHQKVNQVVEESLFVDFSTTFVGYEEAECKAAVIGLVVDGKSVQEMTDGQEGMVILDRTPFYAEMGGQIGDTGSIKAEAGVLEVSDCRAPYQGVIAHFGKIDGKLTVGDSVAAKVDHKRRERIENNHTATHLLHWALQKVLGPHAKQAGSVVAPSRLRFDFNHHKALTNSEIREIESLVNAKIRENLPVKWYEVDYERVQNDQEIKQFFGEKYGKKVRVIDIKFSKELCGGTHASMLGRIGFFKIAKEGSIAAGVRRIEAVTGLEAEKIVEEQEELLAEIAQMVKAKPSKVKEQVKSLIEENRSLAQKLKQLEKDQAGQLASAYENIGSVPVIAKTLSLPSKNLRPFADEVMKKLQSGVIALAVAESKKCQILVMVSDDWIGKGISAKDLIREVSPIINGGGGGKSNAATAGGKAPENLEKALERVREYIVTCAL